MMQYHNSIEQSAQAQEDTMDDITQKKLLRPEEAAAIMSLGRSTIYLMLASGALESFLIGKRRLIPSDSIDAYIASRREEQSAEAQPAGV